MGLKYHRKMRTFFMNVPIDIKPYILYRKADIMVFSFYRWCNLDSGRGSIEVTFMLSIVKIKSKLFRLLIL